MKKIAWVLVSVLTSVGMLLAASPPRQMHYQGVLRSAADEPLNGDFNMIFTFWSMNTGGDEILRDRHLAGNGLAVAVDNGMFGVDLGGGIMQDGSGPGFYSQLHMVFRDFQQVWMEISVNGEILSPRVRILASAYAMNADHLDGQDSSWFLNRSTTAQTKPGRLTLDAAGQTGFALEASGDGGGGHFSDADGTGDAELGTGNVGIIGRGTEAGGYFRSSDASGDTYIAFGDRGIDAWGYEAGGYFRDYDSTAVAYVAYGNRGIEASGSDMGGHFTDSAGTGEARAGYGDTGIVATGNATGGYFEDADGTGRAWVGYGNTGIEATGSEMGAYFTDADESGTARLAYGRRGIEGRGGDAGGYFDELGGSGTAYIASDNYGVKGYGSPAAGYFEPTGGGGFAMLGTGVSGSWLVGDTMGLLGEDDTSGTFCNIAYDTSSTAGNGAKNFLQNHPYDAERLIVYSAPEGDEVATYTRGTARLNSGEARVSLGETFRWVTNPDLGLTVYLTPVGDWSDLYVAAKSTEEIVVRSRDGAPDVAFDYIVWGLRIGFEESSVVRERNLDAYIPSMDEHRDLFERRPELRGYTALERFKEMREAEGVVEALDLTSSRALRDAIQEFDLAVHGRPSEKGPPLGDGPPKPPLPEEVTASAGSGGGTVAESAKVAPEPGPVDRSTGAPTRDADGNVYGRSFRTERPDLASLFPVSLPTEPGDVLVLDPDAPGALRPATISGDRAVFGVVATDPGVVLSVPAGLAPDAGNEPAGLHAAVTFTGVVLCKVDATYASIRPGDLLTTSATPGHAMRDDAPLPGTVLGKAIDGLEVGTGRIRVLVTLR